TGRRWQRLQAAEQAASAARAAAAEAETRHAGLRAQVDALAGRDPEVSRISGARDESDARRGQAVAEISRSASALHECLRTLPTAPAGSTPPAGDDLAGWERHRDELAGAIATAQCRANLLAEWRDRVRDADQELHRELVRYADVVAATCIG